MKQYLPWLLLLIAAIIVVALLLCHRNRKHSPSAASPADGTAQQPLQNPATHEQIDTYIHLCHTQARQQAEAPWRTCFAQNAPACQQLLGLLRAPQEDLATRVRAALDEVHGLTESGFSVGESRPSAVDEAALKALCARLTQAEMADSIMLLRHKLHNMPLDYQTLVTALGGALCSVREALEMGGTESLQASLAMLNSTLEQHGVLARFSDHEEIRNDRELQIRCFTDTTEPVEIPGLFYRNDRGTLACIGRCGGTRRRDDA